MYKKLYRPLANYLKVSNDQTYKLPVALSKCKANVKEFIDAIDRLDCSDLNLVMAEVSGDT